MGVRSDLVKGGCLDEETVLAFLRGELHGPERSLAERHLVACRLCADLTTWAAADAASRSGPVGHGGRPFVGRLTPGSSVDRYQVLSAIGRGGMGEVYAAYHPDLDRRIALKVVHESGAGAPERRARLLREARAIARLSHPNVIAVHDAGTIDDRVYIAMEFVDGETVDGWLRTKTRGWREILDVFVAAGRGLAAAHAAGIVHRDFKPQNVMVGRDGSVRVMDFGLARLVEEPAEAAASQDLVAPRSVSPTVTKTGALVGTLAYMAPEQFRSEAIDARADQFSFCVALHEALYGYRPGLAHLAAVANVADAASPQPPNTPAWLRTVVARGTADSPEERFASMDELLRTMLKARARPRRRAMGATLALAVLLLALGAWRVAQGGRITCAVPTDRLASIWSGRDDSRRTAAHHGFTAGGSAAAETVWQRVSKSLDDYVKNWSVRYVDACEATHVRGEQSGDVLDLRMECLADNLDEVRALTDLFVARKASIANAMLAVQDLAPLNRCDDARALRSAIPPPRDEHAARLVRELRGMIRDVTALDEAGNYRAAIEKALSIRPRIESMRYKPLLGELMSAIGLIEADYAPARAEDSLEQAIVAATGSRDDITAASAASALIYVLGYKMDRPRDAHRWALLAHGFLDRLDAPHNRIRAWILHNEALVYDVEGKTDRARDLLQRALALKEEVLGTNHPDGARSLAALCSSANDAGRPDEALPWCDRACEIFSGIDPDSVLLGAAFNNRAEVLNALGRHGEAETDFQASLRVLRLHYPSTHENLSYPLQGLGTIKLAEGSPLAAIPFLEEALEIRVHRKVREALVAETRFLLSRTLWESGRDRHRALLLAAAAADTYDRFGRSADQERVRTWLRTHR